MVNHKTCFMLLLFSDITIPQGIVQDGGGRRWVPGRTHAASTCGTRGNRANPVTLSG